MTMVSKIFELNLLKLSKIFSLEGMRLFLSSLHVNKEFVNRASGFSQSQKSTIESIIMDTAKLVVRFLPQAPHTIELMAKILDHTAQYYAGR